MGATEKPTICPMAAKTLDLMAIAGVCFILSTPAVLWFHFLHDNKLFLVLELISAFSASFSFVALSISRDRYNLHAMRHNCVKE